MLYINDKYTLDLASKFTITLGDEFQGLLNTGEHVMDLLGEINRLMYPVMFRFGIGIGTIKTEINPELAIGADGPAYYKAREAINCLHSMEKRHGFEAADIRVEAEGDSSVLHCICGGCLYGQKLSNESI